MALNVGTGVPINVSQVVEKITTFFNSSSQVRVTGAFREGDIRYNCADTGKLNKVIGFVPEWRFEDGVKEFLTWASGEKAGAGTYEGSLSEMRELGLMHG
jgi:dTDP-L-rhamnose 4-epimerase